MEERHRSFWAFINACDSYPHTALLSLPLASKATSDDFLLQAITIMSHLTPATYLVWSLLSCLLGIFLVYHLWCFDRFKCLRWSYGTQGTFKRIMTYSYLMSIPLVITYAVGFCIIKYSEGFITLAPYGVIPTPYQFWIPAHRNAILPLVLCLAFGWAFEIVTHLEELCFWLFVINAGPTQKDWFNSMYFKTWVAGSIAAIFYMPLVAIFTRSDPLKCEAYTFLGGSIGSLSLTLSFLPVLYHFRPFLNGLRREGVDMNTIIRLTKFHELNIIRVLFRLLFAVSPFILAVDGLRPHHHINQSELGTELLAMLAGFGVIVSSGLTLVIFFPRSIENEILTRDTGMRSRGLFSSRNQLTLSQEQELYGTYDPEDITPVDKNPEDLSPPLPLLYQKQAAVPASAQPLWEGTPSSPAPLAHPPPTLQHVEPTTNIRLAPNRRAPSPERRTSFVGKLPWNYAERFNNPATRASRMRPSFRSPIELGGGGRS
ncbi:hypothetical protein BC827DRAFT_1216351 [Russula dissimulans]|nr:hypothetical protein BC827DRAFT_1216351 [Russula dissimulans]